MHKTLGFTELLDLIDDRSAAFHAAVTGATDLGVPVPSCPGWTLLDLAQHVGNGRRKWAAIVAAGPASAPPQPSAWESTPDDLPTWLTASFDRLRDALVTAGPDAGTWGWWGDSQSPLTVGTVARRQLQEMAVHTYDAQLALGAPQPLPAAIAVEGVDEFLHTCFSTGSPWPHDPATVVYHAAEGRDWRLTLSAAGARVERLESPEKADATMTATASEIQLIVHGRVPVDVASVDGDRVILDQLGAWEPE
ncbi:hypothetical protein ACTI_63330 [Actinoplanes sp. OR16]|uniref:maleylpyruvate isomerase family mycothiol-dependent enzyme n=1 Tax=Actinoplanes sp. OR16 TaxID=946334 RepID=UPI000F6D643F|nr:maleylpyruvate isomerase family mycothiol-dependent enzyme [Actinoplanes sp. OR16]BBH69648.1 hypothetical protein ACTI_63330 [Actinoplanes sp. OR16]